MVVVNIVRLFLHILLGHLEFAIAGVVQLGLVDQDGPINLPLRHSRHLALDQFHLLRIIAWAHLPLVSSI